MILFYLAIFEYTNLAVSVILAFAALVVVLGHAMLLVAAWRAWFLEFTEKQRKLRGR